MLKVAIVDDENIVRLGLQTFINWEENGYELAGLFRNGQEVLDYCLANPLDILLTDMKMPVMDGMELIKRIKKLQPDLAILVLSNYDEFKLVSEAYKEGINDYLQKQFIEPKSLIAALDGIRERKNKKGSEPRREAADYHTREMKENLLRSLILFNVKSDGTTLDFFGGSTGTSHLFLLLLRPDPNGNRGKAYVKLNHLAANICTVIQETASKYGKMQCLVLDGAEIVLLAGIPEIDSPTGVYDRLSDLGTMVNKTVVSIFNIDFVIACSDIVASVDGLHPAYQETTNAIQQNFYAPNARLFFYKDFKHSEFTIAQETELIRSILSALRIRDYARVKAIISQFLVTASQERTMNPATFKQVILRVLSEIEFFLIQEEDEDALEDIYVNEMTLQSVLDCGSVDRLKELTLQIVQKLVRNNAHPNAISITGATRKYILENYMNPIGLANVSEHLGINSSYLCRLFKEKTGENLSYFISRIRIEKSVELLIKGDLGTDEIAEAVGFPNSNYFVRVFKKITGKTLSEFKGKKDNNLLNER